MINRKPQLQPDEFDLSHGIDTCTRIDLWKLKIPSPDWRAGIRYQPVSVDAFDDAIAHLPINPSRHTFIDLGCGKGRVLILAFEKGFQRVVGVEFSAELCAIARANLDKTGTTAEIFCQSANDYVFPDEPTVVFLYNPFGPTVLASVMKRLIRGSWVVYVNPQYASAIDCTNFHLRYLAEGIAIWHVQ